MMIAGDGFFITRNGGATTLTRAGAFEFDALGRLTSSSGGIVQGRMANNGVMPNGGALTDISLPKDLVAPGVGTTTASLIGNLPKETALGETIVQDKEIFTADGTSRTMSMTFTRTAGGWSVAASDGAGATGTANLTLAANGTLNGGNMNVGGVAVDLSKVTGYAGLKTVSISEQNGRSAGTLESYTLGSDGTLTGTFSNGAQQAIAQIILGSVANPSGLQKAGGSSYTVTANSGGVDYAAPGSTGMGEIAGGMLEMSNVDLSQEFTNLIVAQRGFQANARIITTSDEVLQELASLKR
jgi:flagellar hook protein FlgE